MFRRIVSLLSLLAVLATPSAFATPSARDAQAAQRSQALRFVTLLGRDTIAVEEARWSGDSLRGVILVQEPEVTRFEYKLRAAARGGFESVEVIQSVIGPQGWQERRHASLVAVGDSVQIRIAPDGVDRRVYAPMPLLSLPGSGAAIWFAARRLDALGVDSVSLPWIAPLGGPGGRFIARRVAGPDIEYRLSGGFGLARRDSSGAITAIDARGTTLKIEVLPAGPGVMVEVQERWSRLRGGMLSPRDTVRAERDGADIMVDYGRPSVRGRAVFANGVLGDSVWRTGANAATQLRTSHPLRFSSGELPAGTYSLFTRITPLRSELIINARAGIWGTQYSSTTDVLRIPMERSTVAFQERFTIRVDSSGPALVLHWADQEFRVPFSVVAR